MTVTRHWVITVNSEVPVTGVLNSNDAEFLYEEAFRSGIDINFEEHCKECKAEYHDDCWTDDAPTYLIGYKKDEKGEYVLDEKAEYSAIVGQQETQVLKSGYVSRTTLCSPCFPGQGDLDTPGEFLAYNLPPEVWGEQEHLPIIALKDVEPVWNQDTDTSPVTGLELKVWSTMYKEFSATVYPIGKKMGSDTGGWEYKLSRESPPVEYDSLFESYIDSGKHATDAEEAMRWAKNTIDEWR